jgi:hypothetical protein
MVDLVEIDEINLDKLAKKYRLLDKLTANYLVKLGYYKAIEIRGGPEKSKMGLRLDEKKRESVKKIESQMEKKMDRETAENLVGHLENILENGEADANLGNPESMVEEAHRYCGETGIENKIIRENLVMFTELVSFGYRYKIEGGVSRDEEDGESAKEKKARERIKAVENSGSTGVSGMVKDFLGF